MAKKIILIVLGAVLMLCGLGVAIPGTILTALTGTDGKIASDYRTIGSRTPALVSEPARVSEGSDVPTSGFGRMSRSSSASPEPPMSRRTWTVWPTTRSASSTSARSG